MANPSKPHVLLPLPPVAAVIALALGFLSAACGTDTIQQPRPVTPDAPPAAACVGEETTDVDLQTDDEITLKADIYISGSPNAGSVVLLHMIPPNFSKASYPATFITALTSRGLNVVNVNRRGATGSEGVAEDAYFGPKGKLDAKAAVDFLAAHPCAPDMSSLAFVGASNGTTTALDWAVFAAETEGATAPSSMVFLSPGPYTEAQNPLAAASTKLGDTPILFVYPAEEASYSESIRSMPAPAKWIFTEYTPGSHGSFLFQTNPESIELVAEFVAQGS